MKQLNVAGSFSVTSNNSGKDDKDEDNKPLWQTEPFQQSVNETKGDLSTVPLSTNEKPKLTGKQVFGDSEAITKNMQRYITTGDPKAADEYLKSIKPWIDTAIKSYAKGDANPALRTAAKNIALDATKNYDPAKGTKLQTFLMTHWQGLQRAYTKVNSPVRVPERTAIDIGRVKKYEVELQSQLGRDPTDIELADYMGLPVKTIGKARDAKDFFVESNQLDGQIVPEESKSAKDAWIRYVYMDMNDRDRLVMEHSLGLNGKAVLDTNSIAKKLGVSPGLISQRRTHIENILNEFHDYRLGRK